MNFAIVSHMVETKMRAWWAHRQGLDGRLAGRPAAEMLEQTGWARSVGGCGPYLALFARGGIGRDAVDKAVAAMQIHELPSARGCTYIVPACDFTLALAVGQGFADEERTARKLGVTEREIDRLCTYVVDALSKGPMDPEKLRDFAGNAVRSLGAEGKKKGLATTLPVALRKLQSQGEIRRIPVGGRLDQQRYRYALWRPNPLCQFKLSPLEAFTELARRFFTWIEPATLAEFQWFSGLGVKATLTAVEPLRLEPVQKGSERLMLPGHRAGFQSYRAPKHPRYVLVSSLDGISHLRRDVKGLLAPEDMTQSVVCGRGLTDLSSHAILDRGRLMGLWEYDPVEREIVWMSFIRRSKRLEEAVARVEEFVRDELGDARSFSLDSPKSRAPRIAALRK